MQCRRNDYSQLHRDVCDSLRSSLEGVIRPARATDTLVGQAPREISTAFETHRAQLQQFLSQRFETMFAARQRQVIATVGDSFHPSYSIHGGLQCSGDCFLLSGISFLTSKTAPTIRPFPLLEQYAKCDAVFSKPPRQPPLPECPNSEPPNLHIP